MTKKTFDDGSSIEWIDKETLRYSEKEASVLIWVDYYKVGFLSYGRVVKTSSIMNWDTQLNGSSKIIDANKKQEIIEKLQLYYSASNTKCRIEP